MTKISQKVFFLGFVIVSLLKVVFLINYKICL